MKILEKFLIFGLFSLLFIVNVNAATYDYPSYNVNALSGYLTKYPDKTAQDFFDLIMTRVPDNTQDFYLDNYLILLKNYSDSYSVTIIIATTSDYFSLLTPGTEFRNHNGSSFRYNTLNIFFDSDYNIKSNTSYFDFSSYYTTSYGLYVEMPIYSNNDYIKYDYPGSSTGSISFDGGTAYQYGSDIPLKAFQGTRYDFDVTDYFNPYNQPTYSINQEILPNGNVKLLFNFTDYVEGSGYGFTITNKVNGEEYGIPNPYTSIYPNIIPFENSYEIILGYDTVITVSLSKYTLIEGTQLYDREPLYVDSYDINNVVFDNISQPYFSVLFQNKSNIIGVFNNTDNTMSCYYKFSNSSTENQLDCSSSVNLDFPNNGFVEFIIKKRNNVIYSRKINILGGSETEPYIVYNIEKQDFYTRVNWYVQNYNNQLKFRYSLDNGLNFSTWALLSNNQQFLNVFENSVVIIEISDNLESTIYDSKAINVIVSVENLKNFNNTTNNLIDKFNNIFSVNGNILANIELMWNTIKTSKIYLFVFIPFITSVICAIIYLIRR